MLARAWSWLRSAGSWVLALIVALPIVAIVWRLYRTALARAEDAERRADHAVDALATAIEAGRARAEALRRAEAELGEIHVAAARDKGRIMAFAAELEEIAGPSRAAEIWDRVFDRPASEDPAGAAREKWVAP